MATGQKDTSNSRLLDLPAELREHILAFAVLEEAVIKPKILILRDVYILRLPAITRVSRQLRSESVPLYFEHNVFLFEAEDVNLRPQPSQYPLSTSMRLPSFDAWCETAGRDNVQRIRDFIFAGPGIECFSLHISSLGKEYIFSGRVNATSALPWAGSSPRDREWRRNFRETPVSDELRAIVADVARRSGGTGLLPDDISAICSGIRA